jgi:hypothetical protein
MLNATDQSPKRSNASAQTFEGDTLSRGKAVETAWPYLAGAFTALAHYWVWGRWHAVPLTFRDTLSTAVGLSGAVFGFLLASAAILVTLRRSWYLKRAREAVRLPNCAPFRGDVVVPGSRRVQFGSAFLRSTVELGVVSSSVVVLAILLDHCPGNYDSCHQNILTAVPADSRRIECATSVSAWLSLPFLLRQR